MPGADEPPRRSVAAGWGGGDDDRHPLRGHEHLHRDHRGSARPGPPDAGRGAGRERHSRGTDRSAVELWFGVARSEPTRRPVNETRLRAFLSGPLETLPFEPEDARAAGAIRGILRAAGTPIGAYDLLIAGQALARGLTVATSNLREFTQVAGLDCVDWAPAERALLHPLHYYLWRRDRVRASSSVSPTAARVWARLTTVVSGSWPGTTEPSSCLWLC